MNSVFDNTVITFGLPLMGLVIGFMMGKGFGKSLRWLKEKIEWVFDKVSRSAPLILVGLLLCAGTARAVDTQEITFGWDPVTLNQDGTPCTDLYGYLLYEGIYNKDTGGVETCDPPWTLLTGTIDTQVAVTLEERKEPYCFMVTAIDNAGNESLPSDDRPAYIVHVNPGKVPNVRCIANCK